MDIHDRVIGKVVLISTSCVFVLLSVWINSYPFIDEDTLIHQYIPNPKWFLLFCGLWGLLFIGFLMSLTLYHLYPYL